MNTLVKTRPLTPTQQDRRHRILTAARELVGQHGYEGMVMRDVAVAANVSPTTLYNIYNTKDELLLAALRDKMAQSWSGPSENTGPAHCVFLKHLHTSVGQTIESPEYANAITQALLRAGPGDQLVGVLLEGVRLQFLRTLSTMHKRGELKQDTDLERISVALIGAFWSHYMLLAKGILALDELENALTRIYLSVLIPVSREKTRAELEVLYQQLDT
jgi:AcrR family transcriptional regulator